MNCPYCNGSNTIKKGTRNGTQRYKCRDCKDKGMQYWFFKEINHIEHKGKAPKILVIDIETLPTIAYTWAIWDVNIPPVNIIQDTCILSWSAKWLYDSNIMSDILTSDEAIDRNPDRLVTNIWDLFDEADFAVAYNGLGFDFKHLNTAWITAELSPPSLYRKIDPFPIVKKTFNFTSYKMDYITKKLGLQRKLPTDMSFWIGCSNGEKEALNKMLEYNKHDIIVLEELYLKFRPWMENHPNIGAYHDSNDAVCKYCGSTNITDLKDKFYYTNASKFQTARCNDCTGITRYPKSVLTKEKRKSLMK